MLKTTLGKTGLEVSRIVFGGIIEMNETQNDADKFVSYAIDVGVNYFDVAPSYGNAEERLGPALKPYRNKAILACKTMERTAAGAKAELENSLKTLQTDYFDIYQMHAITSMAEVDQIFSEDGALKTFLQAKKDGYIRNIGFSAHNEPAALATLAQFDFDTVMFPINWALHLSETLGTKIPEEAAKKQMGLIAIKALAHRKWHNEAERQRLPKSWCKTIFDNEQLAIAAIKYALHRKADALIPPGNFEQFCFMQKHIAECVANPLTEDDLTLLKNAMPKPNEHIFNSL
ncbi:MAG: aldo/keto reductase [Defluviitaleaceae bacterium]|nr:aldo/keto reductase [Defluviitaleaceae bacterium]